MNTKNVILALAAIVFALGSAFTTKNADLANNVRVWLKETSDDPFECTLIPRECLQEAEGLFCRVSIVKASGIAETVNAYGDSGCTIQLRHTETSESPEQYDAGVNNRPFDVSNSQ